MGDKNFDFEPTSLTRGVWRAGDGWTAAEDHEVEEYGPDEAMLLEWYDAKAGKLASVKIDAQYLVQWGTTDYVGIKFTGVGYRVYRDRTEAINAIARSLPAHGSSASTELVKIDDSRRGKLGCHRYKFIWDEILGWTIEAQAVEFKL